MRHSQLLTITNRQFRPRSADPTVIYIANYQPYWHWNLTN
ncbi:hypothetical protein N644_1773 [Lactiplantibacillus paraplantarum]|uniref:Uncharacterized protein n=1 Tax=Lactiplantibacillus paraplantarum TaxID=60520 RepID=A0ABQ0N737_9LACO|nr:hypothetical protein N644_1773 [Lactiplantibacillus paraplantarum]GBF00802.1 hypothetical protein LPPLD21_00304 [Lactiplantibacillus paraplantarum]